MSELNIMLSVLKIVADESEKTQGVDQAQCILASIQMLEIQHEKIVALTAERDQLTQQVEELKAMQVDALGDGWCDGYLQCKKDAEAESETVFSTVEDLTEIDVIQMSEDYESNHRYSKSINDIKIKAVCEFKDELTKSVSVMFKPHIEGVCAVVIEKMKAAKDGE